MILYRKGFNKWVAMLIVAALAALGATPAHAKSPVITGVQVNGAPGNLKIHVSATGKVSYKVQNLTEPHDMLVIDISPAQLATDVQKSVDVKAGLVDKVRVGQFSDDQNIVRLVVDLKAPVKYSISMTPAGVMVALGGEDVSAAKASTAAVTPATPAATETSAQSVPTIKIAPAASTVTRTSNVPVKRDVISVSMKPAAPVNKPVRVAEATEADVSTHTYVSHNGYVKGSNDEIAAAARKRRPVHRYACPRHTVSLDFVNADLIYVLKILAKELNLNLVTDNTVKGTVTMTLKNVSPSFALAMILKIAGFESTVTNSTLVVGGADTISKVQTIPVTQDFGAHRRPPGILPIPLEHAKAASVADTIKSVYPDAKVTVQADQNFVVVTAPGDQLRTIKEFVQKLDVPPPPPVVLKTEIVPIKYATVTTTLALAKSLYPMLNYAVEDRLNSLIVTGQDKDIEALKAFLATVDTPVAQVLLDIRVVSLSEDGTKTLGMTIGSSNGNFGVFAGAGGAPITFTENLPGTTAQPLGGAPVGTNTNSLAIAPFTRTPFVLGASLSMLIARNDAKVISTPRIMAQSGKDATVLIGDKFPIVYFDPRAGQFQVQYVDIGVKLAVKPTVAADGFVTVDLTPEVSTLEGLINNQYPRTGVTTVKTTVRVRDGDTIVVGGLLREIETYTMQKLPFLGDLPILGEFFRNTNVERTKNEVFITVTPKIMP